MARPNSSLPKPCTLLVEGQDDEHVVRHLLRRREAALDFVIENREGIEPLLDSIGAELRAPGRQALGLLVDADTDLSSRWDAVKTRLSAEDIELPGHPAVGGTSVAAVGKPRVGVWLMPDNTSGGELEDFVVQLIPAGDPLWPMAQHYIDTIPQQERKFSQQKTQRARLYAWLAARKDPRRMDSAIGAHDLEVSGVLCHTFIAWLQALFAKPYPISTE